MERMQEALGLVPGNPLRPFTLGLLAFLGLAVVAAAVLLAVDRIWALVVGVVALAVLITLPILVVFGRVYVRDMRRLLAGEHWARWRYEPAEWERFAAHEWARTRREARFGGIASRILAIVIAVFAALVGGSGSVALLAAGLVLAVGLVVSLGIYLAGRARYARRGREVGDVTVGPLGVHHPGRYAPLAGFNLRLAAVRVEPGTPSVLHLVTKSWSQYGARTQETRVPIPHGREADAEALAARFRAEFRLDG